MKPLSEPVHRLQSELASGSFSAPEYIVIGSGYGGAVAAARLAEAGKRVLVLERGREYLPGDFPAGLSDIVPHVRVEFRNRAKPWGFESALFDIRVGQDTVTLVGNALGGGSQINANVVLEPAPETLTEPPWPAALRNDARRGALDAYFERVRATLGVTSLPFAEAERRYPKARALGRMAGNPGDSEAPASRQNVLLRRQATPLAVKFAGIDLDVAQRPGTIERADCTECGNCVSGCNYGAKGTLSTNYLPLARAAGARIVTDATVLAVQRTLTGEWTVHGIPTSQRQRLREWEQANGQPWDPDSHAAPLAGQLFAITAPNVIIAAGTLGTAEILECSRRGKHALTLSARFGEFFSGNGDHLAFSFAESEAVVDAFGWADPTDVNRPIGPTITATLQPASRSAADFVVQDAAVPGPIGRLVHEGIATVAALHGVDDDDFDPVSLHPVGADNTQVFLAMGRPQGERHGHRTIRADPVTGRMFVGGLAAEDRLEFDDYVDVIDRHLRKPTARYGGEYLSNPVWRLLPPAIETMIAGLEPRGAALVAHPLGGCAMGDNAEEGVVDHRGRVFQPAAGAGTYDGLYVLDGSIVPGPIGVNPLLTIAALAERATALILAEQTSRITWRNVTQRTVRWLTGRPFGASQDIAPVALQAVTGPVPEFRFTARQPVALTLAEVLRGKFEINDESSNAVFRLRFRFDDMEDWLGDISAPVPLTRDSEFRIETSSGETVYRVVHGTIRFLAKPDEADDATRKLVRMISLGRRLAHRFLGKSASDTDGGELESLFSALGNIGAITLMLGNALDGRVIQYEFDMERLAASGAPPAGLDERIHVTAVKVIDFLRGEAWSGEAHSRQHVLRMLTDPFMRISGRSMDVPGATFTMDIADTIHHNLPQVLAGDTTRAIVDLLGYPMLFLRFALRSLVLEFRLPDYERDDGLRNADPGVVHQVDQGCLALIKPTHYLPALRTAHGRVLPHLHRVSLADDGYGAPLDLALWRYPQKDAVPTNGDACKSIVLFHAFGQPALAFADLSIEMSPAQAFHERGYDVWLCESRISTALDGATAADLPGEYVEPCRRDSTLDDLARIDVPAAIAHVRRILSVETGIHEPRVFAFAQCVGAASLAMSILSGRLVVPATDTAPESSMLSGVVLSQFVPFCVGDPCTQARTSIPAFLRDVLRLRGVNFSTLDSSREYRQRELAAKGVKSDAPEFRNAMAPLPASGYKSTLTDSLIDLLAGIYPPEGPGPEIHHAARPYQANVLKTQAEVTCRRIAAIEAPLFAQQNLTLATFRRMPILFGHANLTLFDHARRCIEYERLVDANGANVYVTQNNIRRYLNMPLGLLHGRDNRLFNVESTQRTARAIAGIRGDLADPDGNFDDCTSLRTFYADAMGHLDCIIGKDTERVFTGIIDYLDDVFDEPPSLPVSDEQPLGRLRLAAEGPIMGWVRREHGAVAVRLFARADNSESDPAIALLLSYQTSAHGRKFYYLLPESIDTREGWEFVTFVGDLLIPVGDIDDACDLEILTFHHPIATGYRYDLDGIANVLHGIVNVPLAVNDAGETESTTQHVADQVNLDPALYAQWRNALIARLDLDRHRLFAAAPGTHSFELRRDRDISDALVTVRLPPEPTAACKIVLGNCRYPGFGFESGRVDTAAFARIRTKEDDASALLLLGDQIYADATAGLFDRLTRVEHYVARYRQLLGAPHVAACMRAIPTYMTADDHEYRDGWRKTDEALAPKLFAAASFTRLAYQQSHGPLGRRGPPFDYAFDCGGFAIYVMDTIISRFEDPRPGHETIVQESQLDAFEHWIKGLSGCHTVVLASGAVVVPGLETALDENDVTDHHRSATLDGWQAATRQRLHLLQIIANSKHDVILVAGDYHCWASARITDVHGETVARAVVAPAAYAPMRYVNRKADELASREVIGGEFVVELEDSGDGSGYAVLERPASGPVSIRFESIRIAD